MCFCIVFKVYKCYYHKFIWRFEIIDISKDLFINNNHHPQNLLNDTNKNFRKIKNLRILDLNIFSATLMLFEKTEFEPNPSQLSGYSEPI